MTIFQVDLGWLVPECVHSRLQWSWWCGRDNWSYNSAKLQLNHHHKQTKDQPFTGQMPFLSPNQQCQSTEENNTPII